MLCTSRCELEPAYSRKKDLLIAQLRDELAALRQNDLAYQHLHAKMAALNHQLLNITAKRQVAANQGYSKRQLLRASILQLQSERDALKAVARSRKVDQDDLVAQLEAAAHLLQNRELEMEELRFASSNLQQEGRQLQNQQGQLKKKLIEVGKARTSRYEDLVVLEENNDSANASLECAGKDSEQKHQQLMVTERELHQLKLAIGARGSHSADMRAEVDELGATSGLISEKLKELRARLGTLSSQVDRLKYESNYFGRTGQGEAQLAKQLRASISSIQHSISVLT